MKMLVLVALMLSLICRETSAQEMGENGRYTTEVVCPAGDTGTMIRITSFGNNRGGRDEIVFENGVPVKVSMFVVTDTTYLFSLFDYKKRTLTFFGKDGAQKEVLNLKPEEIPTALSKNPNDDLWTKQAACDGKPAEIKHFRDQLNENKRKLGGGALKLR